MVASFKLAGRNEGQCEKAEYIGLCKRNGNVLKNVKDQLQYVTWFCFCVVSVIPQLPLPKKCRKLENYSLQTLLLILRNWSSSSEKTGEFPHGYWHKVRTTTYSMYLD